MQKMQVVIDFVSVHAPRDHEERNEDTPTFNVDVCDSNVQKRDRDCIGSVNIAQFLITLRVHEE